ncbi:phage adaptor protein [Xanthobacter sediminis]
MSAFQNIIDLRFAVSDHVGNRAISDVFPRLVEMAETDLNTRLRTRWQIRDATLTFEGGEAMLPPDFLELIRVQGRGPGDFQVTSWSIAMPGRKGAVEAQYYARIPSLTNSPTASNWLLQRYPSVYLYGVALEAAKFLRDADLSAATASLYGDALRQLTVDDARARWSAATVRVKGPTP